MNIDEIYLKIANNIIDAIGSEWAIATINCKLAPNYGGFKCVYKEDISSIVDHDFDISFETFEAFEILHKITTEDGASKWNRATFTLYSTGKSSTNFEWDQELADEIGATS